MYIYSKHVHNCLVTFYNYKSMNIILYIVRLFLTYVHTYTCVDCIILHNYVFYIVKEKYQTLG